jgi:toxin ParE1/3/4
VAVEASEAIATRLLTKIEATFTQAQHFPLSGVAREQLRPGLRATFEGNYAIYYTVTETEIVNVRVLHGARDAAALADRGGYA